MLTPVEEPLPSSPSFPLPEISLLSIIVNYMDDRGQARAVESFPLLVLSRPDVGLLHLILP